MDCIDFNKPMKVHFIGIGGSSMSGLANILLSKGFIVTGSDTVRCEATIDLENKGCHIYYPQSKNNIEDDVSYVVYTAAIHEDNEELAHARTLNIPCDTRAVFLGKIMKNYNHSINISGTHGKTTTSSLVADILITANLDPTVSVGGVMQSINSNMRIGSSDTFVTEACEYTNSFLHSNPTIAVILNIKEDHLDFFKDLDDIRASFKNFANLLDDSGTLIINSSIEDISYFTPESYAKVLTYGLDENSNYYPKNITFDSKGRATYDLYNDGKFLTTIKLSLSGIHNVENSIAAIVAALVAGASLSDCVRACSFSSGAYRRLEDKGYFNEVRVIDDYAHHPDEIAATLKAINLMAKGDVYAIFQPHTYSRTKDFLNEFALALKENSTTSILLEVYNDREINTYGVSSKDITNIINENGGHSLFFDTFLEVENYLRKNCKKGDIVVTLGSKDVFKIADNLVRN